MIHDWRQDVRRCPPRPVLEAIAEEAGIAVADITAAPGSRPPDSVAFARAAVSVTLHSRGWTAGHVATLLHTEVQSVSTMIERTQRRLAERTGAWETLGRLILAGESACDVDTKPV